MSEEVFDIVVVGGGITGAGIARDAAMRGLRVALFEKDDYASGTSSKSSKLIHGGLRYLEQGEIALVFESVSERRVQMQMAPHLVRPLPFLLPIYKDSRVGLELTNIGLWIYDLLALFRSPRLHKTMRGLKKVERLEPAVRREGITGAIEYHDCIMDDARLALENIIAAQEAGAVCDSYTKVINIRRKRGKVDEVTVQDLLSGHSRTLRTRCVVMATGPWSDRVVESIDAQMTTPILRPTKGVHLVFPKEKLPLKRALTLLSPIDGRVMFAFPWRGRTVIGTTDTDFRGDPNEVHCDAEDAAYLCRSANYLFPRSNFQPDDVIATWAGLRPLIHQDAESASEVSREHQIYVNDDGVLLIAGGKYTTYRIMAKDTVDAAIRWIKDHCNDPFWQRDLRVCQTKTTPLPGGVGLAEPTLSAVRSLGTKLSEESGLAKALTRHWVLNYGSRATELVALAGEHPQLVNKLQDDLAFTWVEVEYAISHELCKTLDDVLARRIPLLLVGLDQGLDVAVDVADYMGARLGWSNDRKAQELALYHKSVTDSRGFRYPDTD